MGFFNKVFGTKKTEMSSWEAPIVVKFNEIDGNIEIIRTHTRISNAPFFGFIPPNEYNLMSFGFRKLNGIVSIFFQDSSKNGKLKKGVKFKFTFEMDKELELVAENSPIKLPKVGKSLVKNEISLQLDNDAIELFSNYRLLTFDYILESQLPERYSIPATISYTDKITGDAPVQIIRIFRKIASF